MMLSSTEQTNTNDDIANVVTDNALFSEHPPREIYLFEQNNHNAAVDDHDTIGEHEHLLVPRVVTEDQASTSQSYNTPEPEMPTVPRPAIKIANSGAATFSTTTVGGVGGALKFTFEGLTPASSVATDTRDNIPETPADTSSSKKLVESDDAERDPLNETNPDWSFPNTTTTTTTQKAETEDEERVQAEEDEKSDVMVPLPVMLLIPPVFMEYPRELMTPVTSNKNNSSVRSSDHIINNEVVEKHDENMTADDVVINNETSPTTVISCEDAKVDHSTVNPSKQPIVDSLPIEVAEMKQQDDTDDCGKVELPPESPEDTSHEATPGTFEANIIDNQAITNQEVTMTTELDKEDNPSFLGDIVDVSDATVALEKNLVTEESRPTTEQNAADVDDESICDKQTVMDVTSDISPKNTELVTENINTATDNPLPSPLSALKLEVQNQFQKIVDAAQAGGASMSCLQNQTDDDVDVENGEAKTSDEQVSQNPNQFNVVALLTPESMWLPEYNGCCLFSGISTVNDTSFDIKTIPLPTYCLGDQPSTYAAKDDDIEQDEIVEFESDVKREISEVENVYPTPRSIGRLLCTYDFGTNVCTNEEQSKDKSIQDDVYYFAETEDTPFDESPMEVKLLKTAPAHSLAFVPELYKSVMQSHSANDENNDNNCRGADNAESTTDVEDGQASYTHAPSDELGTWTGTKIDADDNAFQKIFTIFGCQR